MLKIKENLNAKSLDERVDLYGAHQDRFQLCYQIFFKLTFSTYRVVEISIPSPGLSLTKSRCI